MKQKFEYHKFSRKTSKIKSRKLLKLVNWLNHDILISDSILY